MMSTILGKHHSVIYSQQSWPHFLSINGCKSTVKIDNKINQTISIKVIAQYLVKNAFKYVILWTLSHYIAHNKTPVKCDE